MIGARIRRIAFTMVLATLLISHLGCATYRDGALPAPGMQGDETSKDVVAEGDSVRLSLYSGKSYSGNVIWVTNDKLKLGGLGNYGLPDLIIQLAEIEKLELRNQSGGQI